MFDREAIDELERRWIRGLADENDVVAANDRQPQAFQRAIRTPDDEDPISGDARDPVIPVDKDNLRRCGSGRRLVRWFQASPSWSNPSYPDGRRPSHPAASTEPHTACRSRADPLLSSSTSFVNNPLAEPQHRCHLQKCRLQIIIRRRCTNPMNRGLTPLRRPPTVKPLGNKP